MPVETARRSRARRVPYLRTRRAGGKREVVNLERLLRWEAGRPPVFGSGSVRLERVHVEHDVKRAENRAERLQWKAGFAIDYAIASIEQGNLAVLDAVDGDWRSTLPRLLAGH